MFEGSRASLYILVCLGLLVLIAGLVVSSSVSTRGSRHPVPVGSP